MLLGKPWCDPTVIAAALARFVFAFLLAGSTPAVILGGQTCDAPPGYVPPFIPTPFPVAKRMLEVAGVGPNDIVYDLGSGDGRIVIMAAQEFRAHAVGVEIDEKLVNQSRARIAKLYLDKVTRVIHGDVFKTDLTPATVVTLYLSTAMNRQLRPRLEKQLPHGARVVAEQCQVPGWIPQKILVPMRFQGGPLYRIYLYVRP